MAMRYRLMIVLLVLWLAGVGPLGAQPNPQQIVSPRPQSWVSDQAGMLAPAARASLDAQIDRARAQRAVEIAILTVADIGNADPRQFATAVFNHWGIGDPQRNDGVLLFIAREQRAAEIILGDGIDSSAEQATSQRLMDQRLLPHLRRGDVEGGLRSTVDGLLSELHGIAAADVERPQALAAVERDRAAPRPLVQPLPLGEANATDESTGLPLRLSLAGLGTALGLLALRWWWRIRGRRCPRCHAPMLRLGEVADDAHLQSAQQLEEQLGSVDYDVWACSACSFVDTRRYAAWFSRFARCGQCRTVALERSQTTLTTATYDHGGRVRVDEHCRHCGHQRQYERSTPKRTRSSSSSSGSGFSGGRSSGGGASGRW